MCISIIRSKTDAIETLAESEAGSVHDSLKLLLGLFSQVERALEAIDDEDEGAFRRREDLIDLEAHILTKAAALKAPLIRDALYKLALWRCGPHRNSIPISAICRPPTPSSIPLSAISSRFSANANC